MSDLTWKHAGISEIKQGKKSGNTYYSIRIPDRIIDEASILKTERPVYWSYEENVEWVLISDDEFTHPEYEYVTTTRLGSDRVATVPKQFFEDYQGRGGAKGDNPLEEVRLQPGMFLHFMYKERMATPEDGAPASAYAFTEKQFDERFSSSDRWDDELSGIPRFS